MLIITQIDSIQLKIILLHFFLEILTLFIYKLIKIQFEY